MKQIVHINQYLFYVFDILIEHFNNIEQRKQFKLHTYTCKWLKMQ